MTTKHAMAHRSTATRRAVLSHHFDDVAAAERARPSGCGCSWPPRSCSSAACSPPTSLYRPLTTTPSARRAGSSTSGSASLNTIVLLTSSLTMALAVRAARRGSKTGWSAACCTMVLGAAFLGIKACEWKTDYHEHLVPGINFDGPPSRTGRATIARQRRAEVDHGTESRGERDASAARREHALGHRAGKAEMFFVLYFFMTGLHAIHLIIGIVLVGLIACSPTAAGSRAAARRRSRSPGSTGTSSTSSGSSSIPCST